MLNKRKIENTICKLKNSIKKQIECSNFNNALIFISICANILYSTNLYYMDDYLEDSIINISNNVVSANTNYNSDNETVVFYDGFGLDYRGLIRQYLNALCQCKKVVYVTYETRKNEIPNIIKLLNKYNAKTFFIKKNTPIKQIDELNSIITQYAPRHFFFYSYPSDVVGATILSAYGNRLIRYQINLTDHAFWLSAKSIDKCLEFREYGANISYEYRKIDRTKLYYCPYYPIVDKTIEFSGFPFNSINKKIVFSGGALYKTIDKSNNYYKIVDYILKNNNNVIFWYAGSGDKSKLIKIIEKYPNRAYITAERKDIYQVIENCTFYLNTYPLVGGLMMQLAAMAGKVPLTLKNDIVGDGILINQDSLNIMFDNIDDLENEANKLLQNEEYLNVRKEVLKNCVVSEKEFNENIKKILNNECSFYNFELRHQDTEKFRAGYLISTQKKSLYSMFVKKNVSVIINYPVMFMIGFTYRVLSKVKRKIIKK